MTHDRNFRFGQTGDQVQAPFAAFYLDGFRSSFFYEAHGVANGFTDFAVVCAIRHVRDEQCSLYGAPDGFGVVQRFV